jgi:hypothetical protein
MQYFLSNIETQKLPFLLLLLCHTEDTLGDLVRSVALPFTTCGQEIKAHGYNYAHYMDC